MQVRLADGNIVKNTFQATDTFETVWQWLKSLNKFPDGAVLQNSYPRTVFDASKAKVTLKDAGTCNITNIYFLLMQLFAGLVPSGSLVVNLGSKEQAHQVKDIKSKDDKV